MNPIPAHTPKLGATIHYLPSFRNSTISIYAPAWGATFTSVSPRYGYRGFNPRSHVGSDNLLSGNNHLFDVSIHAPAWGATLCTHTNINKWAFQSTLQRGERHRHETTARPLFQVSIHAPAWGATVNKPNKRNVEKFQSTLPRGERHL